MRTLTLSHPVQAIAYEDHDPKGVIAEFTASNTIAWPISSREYGVYLLHCIPGYVLKRARHGQMDRAVLPEEEDQVLAEIAEDKYGLIALGVELFGKTKAEDLIELRRKWEVERELEAVNGPRIRWGEFYPKVWLRQNCQTEPRNCMLEERFAEILVLNCRDKDFEGFVLELNFNDESNPRRWLRTIHNISPSTTTLGQVEVATA